MSLTDNSILASEEDYLFTQASQLPNAGFGLYTAIDIYKGEIISVFKGEHLTNDEAAQRSKAGLDGYFINLLDGTIMDSMSVDCFAKYANDAHGTPSSSFKNNARITLDENENICIEATRLIRAKEEVFCAYGKAYWKKHG